MTIKFDFQEELADSSDILDDMLQKCSLLKLSVEDAIEPIRNSVDDFRTIENKSKELASDFDVVNKDIKKSLNDITRSFGDNFLNIITGSTDKFSKKLERLVNIANQRIQNDLVKDVFIGDFGSRGKNSFKLGGVVGEFLNTTSAKGVIENGFETGDIFKALSKFFGFRASGGPTMQGRPYIVGEKGPEIFIPGSNGHISPNNNLNNQSNISLTMNIQTNDAESFARSEKQIAADMRRFLNNSLRSF